MNSKFPAAVYQASPVKGRLRRSNKQLEIINEAIITAVSADAPVTLRGVYYRVVSAGAIDKTEQAYQLIGRQLLKLRRANRIKYSDITDGTRWILAPTTYDSLADAIDETARTYRRSLWTTSPWRIQIFSEKDAISGVVQPISERWDVPLGVLRGYVSETFAWNVGQSLDKDHNHVLVQLGDHDPSGVDAWDDFCHKVDGFAHWNTQIEFVRLAVTPEQIDELKLPTRPTKLADTRAKGWEGGSVEVDAIPASVLRKMLDEFIAAYVDEHQLAVIRTAEESERKYFMQIADRLGGKRR